MSLFFVVVNIVLGILLIVAGFYELGWLSKLFRFRGFLKRQLGDSNTRYLQITLGTLFIFLGISDLMGAILPPILARITAAGAMALIIIAFIWLVRGNLFDHSRKHKD